MPNDTPQQPETITPKPTPEPTGPEPWDKPARKLGEFYEPGGKNKPLADLYPKKA